MNGFGSERSWRVYASSDQNSSQHEGISRGAPPVKSSETSMSAISFGFVATAILIAMFLIMAIFEHLFRPPTTTTTFSSPHDNVDGSMESRAAEKTRHSQNVPTLYTTDFSVLMPGERYPTFIAQPAPRPCPRERVYWPAHEHSFVFP